MKPYYIDIPELVVDVQALLAELPPIKWVAGGKPWPEGLPHPTGQEGRFEISNTSQLGLDSVKAITNQLLIKPTYAIFMRTLPGQQSNRHVDVLRYCGLNINLDEHFEESKVDFYDSLTEGTLVTTKVHTDHTPILYNVKLPHQTVNGGLENRYVLSLSYQTPFDDLVALYESGRLLKVQ